MIITSSSSTDDDVSLGAEQEEAPVSTHNVASSSDVPQLKGDVPSHQDP